MKSNCKCCKLSSLSLAIAAAAVSALGMLILGMLHMYLGIGAKMIELIATLYTGYAANWHGIALGAGYAAIEGFFSGLLFGWIYNLCVCCMRKCGRSCSHVCETHPKAQA